MYIYSALLFFVSEFDANNFLINTCINTYLLFFEFLLDLRPGTSRKAQEVPRPKKKASGPTSHRYRNWSYENITLIQSCRTRNEMVWQM